MPELPDIVVYLEALEQRVLGHVLERVRIAGPFLLRTAVPPIDSVQGHKVTELRRIGKRIAVGFENGMWLVFHLMIAGRLHWKTKAVVPDGRRTLATFEFDSGTLSLTEAGAYRSAFVQWNRQCVFRRDTFSGAAFAGFADAADGGGSDRSVVSGDTGDVEFVDENAARRSGREVSGESDGVSGKDVRSRAIRAAVQTVWDEDTADSVCVE